VRRTLGLATVHYVPVAFVAAATAGVHLGLLDLGYLDWQFWDSSSRICRFILGGQAMLGAVYLFVGYGIAVKNMMYANR
jgi:hypothetical protein